MQCFRGDFTGDARGKQTGAGAPDCGVIGVRSKDLNGGDGGVAAQTFQNSDGKRVNFFSSRASDRPDAYLAARVGRLEEPRQNLRLKGAKDGAVAEKPG